MVEQRFPAELTSDLLLEEDVPSAATGWEDMIDLRPWQRFVLAALLFLDVAVVGFLFLVMLGRMSFG
ncbi:MAG: hypothetical protein U9R05_02555 [Chloroflexota bacterium]|nr:hypothetical protein [Chloroflexota bacterium]